MPAFAVDPRHTVTRKTPRQARSKALVEALLRACARILSDEGWDALTTNRVAKEAGVSIGSLYQYFPSRDALVQALLAEWVNDATSSLVSLAAELKDAPLSTCIDRIVRSALDLARADARLHRAVFLQLPRIGALSALETLNRRAADMLAEWITLRRDELDVADPGLTAHVIITSLDALTDHALLFRPEWLESQRFEAELRRSVSRTLGAREVMTPRRRR